MTPVGESIEDGTRLSSIPVCLPDAHLVPSIATGTRVAGWGWEGGGLNAESKHELM